MNALASHFLALWLRNTMTIRILHVIPQVGFGGACRAMLALAKFSQKLGDFSHEVLSIHEAFPNELAFVQDSGLRVFNGPNEVDRSKLLASADIVHAHWWNHPSYATLFRSTLPPMRLAIWFHVAGDHPPQILTRKLIDFVDLAVACSPYTYEHQVFETLPPNVRASKTAMVYGAADFERLAGFAMRPHAGFHLGYVGTISFTKMHPNFVRMHAALQIPDCRVFVCGDGNTDPLRKQAEQLGALGRFEFPGYAKEVARVLEVLDVYGYPLCEDTYAASELTLQEAMFAGLPPVVFPYGGIKRLVVNDFTGLVVKSELEYQQAIEHLWRTPVERARLGTNAREYARQIFGAENAAQKINPLYARLVAIPKRVRVWGITPEEPIVAQPLTLRDVVPSADADHGSTLFIEGLGPHARPFEVSVASRDLSELLLADAHIREASPLMRSRFAGGILHYRAAFPGDRFLRFWCGLALQSQRDHAGAMGEFRAANILGFPHWRTAFHQGSSALEVGDARVAASAIRFVLAMAPDFQDARDLAERIRRHAAYVEQPASALRDAEDAYLRGDFGVTEHLCSALLKSGDDAAPLTLLARLSSDVSNLQQAVEFLERAITKQPTFTDAWVVLAEIARRANDNKTLDNALNNIRHLAPDHPSLREFAK